MSIFRQKLPRDEFRELMLFLKSHRWLSEKEDSLMDLWDICDVPEQRALLSELISLTANVDEDELKKICLKIFEWIDGIRKNYKETYIVAVSEATEVDGSSVAAYYLKKFLTKITGFSEGNLVGTIGSGAKINCEGACFILIDDFIGSGKKLSRRVKWFIENSSADKAAVFVCGLASMSDGEKVLSAEYGEKFFVPLVVKKAISEVNATEVAEKKKELMLGLEEKLSSSNGKYKLETFKLGYAGSEAMIRMPGDNCPNNVFPIFWWPKDSDGNRRETLMQRLGDGTFYD